MTPLAALLALALLTIAAPSGASSTPAQGPALVPDSKVGKVQGTRAYIALSVDRTRLRVYVCDGRGRRGTTISAWLERRWDGRSPVTLVRDGIRVRIRRVHADGRVNGDLTAFSGPHAFTVRPASGPAGLYDGIDGHRRATWIVLGDRSVRGTFVSPRPPRRVCRLVTVTLSDGTTQQRMTCSDV